MRKTKNKIKLTKNIPNFELQENTLHFLFECDDYFHNQDDDVIHDKLDFFEDNVIINAGNLLFNHDIDGLLYHTSKVFTFFWKIIKKIYSWLGDEFKNMSDFELLSSEKYGGENAINLMKLSYNIICSLIYDNLDRDDIVKIHELLGEKEYPNLEKTYTILQRFETTS